MNWDLACRIYSDAARPSTIYALGASLAIAPFVHADLAAAGLVAAAYAGSIGARSFENHTQIRADAETKKTEVAASAVAKAAEAKS